MKKCKLLLLDLDGTLLQSDKTISTRTLSALKKCRENDILIGVSTSRSEQNSLVFLNELMPDILISSGGALVKYKTEYIYRAEFSEEETNVMIDMARNICGNDCEITIDTIDAHYWNYKIDPKKLDKSWGDSIYTDFSDFNECSLKMCVEIFNQDKADKLARSLSDCDCIRFSDGFWYKFTKKNVTKENAIMKITEVCGFSTDSIIAFGDDYADIGMLELCGTGVAMGNGMLQAIIIFMPYIIPFLTTALVVWVIKKIIEKFTYDFSTISGDSRRIAREKARKMGNVVDMISSFKDITESIKK